MSEVDLLKARKSVKEKLSNLRYNALKRESNIREQYKPILEPLEKIVTTMNIKRRRKGNISSPPTIHLPTISTEIQPQTSMKMMSTSESQTPMKIMSASESQTPMKTMSTSESQTVNTPNFLSTEVVAQSDLPEIEEEDDEVFNPDPEVIEKDAFETYLDQYDELPRKYIEEMLLTKPGQRNAKYDTIYGLRHDFQSDKFYIGDSEVKIKGNEIFVNEKSYQITPGLLELLFMNEPEFYSLNDEKNYIDIIKTTNAQYRNYDPTKQIRGNKSYKYKTVIGSHFPTRRRIKSLEPHSRSISLTSSAQPSIHRYSIGGGMTMMDVTSKPKEYVYYDDPNELVDRLRLLISSAQTGNNSHTNEINSIVEELTELDLIE